jgi:hypothetical protein
MNLLTFGFIRIGGEVGYPYIALIIHIKTVRGDHQASAKISQHRAGVAIKFEDGINQVGVAGDWHTGTKATCAATLVCPEVAIKGIDINTGR